MDVEVTFGETAPEQQERLTERLFAATYRIALDLPDLDLRDALTEALSQHPALILVDVEDAPALTTTDGAVGAPEPIAVLRLDAPPALLTKEHPLRLSCRSRTFSLLKRTCRRKAAGPRAGPRRH